MRILLLIIGVLSASLVQAGGLLIVVSNKVPDNKISLEQLANIYTMKKVFWKNNIRVVPINHKVASEERKRFSKVVFNLSPKEVGDYWNRLRYEGKLPPVIQASDQAVLGFVRKVPGAIGYINANQKLTGVKILLRLP